MGSSCVKSAKKERILCLDKKLKETIPFLCLLSNNKYPEVTNEAKEYLLGLSATKSIMFVINYGHNTKAVRNILLYKNCQVNQINKEVKVYLSMIEQSDTLITLLLDWVGQMHTATFTILLAISSLFFYTGRKGQISSSQRIDQFTEILPASYSAIQTIKQFDQKIKLPAFLWLYSDQYSHFALGKYSSQGYNQNLYHLSKRNFDREAFKEIFTDIRFEKSRYLESTVNIELQKLHKNIMSNLELRVWNGFNITPKMAISFISFFGNCQISMYYCQRYSQTAFRLIHKKTINESLSFLLRKYKENQDDSEQSIEIVQRYLVQIVKEHKTIINNDHQAFKDLIDFELKKQGLDKIEIIIKRQKKTEVEINFNQISHEIEQKIRQSKQSVWQILVEEKKRLQGEVIGYSQKAKVIYLEKIRDFFDQKIIEEMARLEKENEEIKMMVKSEIGKSATMINGSNQLEFVTLQQEELL